MTTPNLEQSTAISAMLEFLQPACKESFFLLSGAAGTGKTFTVKELLRQTKGRLIFTAPTNKATKVLAETFAEEDLGIGYKPECRTIFSLLALRLEANGAVKELTHPEDPVDLSNYTAVIVDEASMINSNLWAYINKTSKEQRLKFIFMGDAAQLPPVGEISSPVWGLPSPTNLLKVMRHDNQILELATRIRGQVNHPAPSVKIITNHSKGEGVQKLDKGLFTMQLNLAAVNGDFNLQTHSKVIAWRNITVEVYNKLIRRAIFPDAAGEYFPEDRIIMMEPAKSFTDDKIVATTDMEGTVERSEITYHPEHGEMKCYRIVAQMDDKHPITLWKLHAESLGAWNRKVADLSAAAKSNGRLWREYWKFREAFHQLRYAYAITAHRAQGSTYQRAFVDVGDILANYNRQEAYRCLYVACTRPKKELFITF